MKYQGVFKIFGLLILLPLVLYESYNILFFLIITDRLGLVYFALGLISIFLFLPKLIKRKWSRTKSLLVSIFILIFLNAVPLYRSGADCSGPDEPKSISIGWPLPIVSYFLGNSGWGGCSGYSTDGPGYTLRKGDVRYSLWNIRFNLVVGAILLPIAFWKIRTKTS